MKKFPQVKIGGVPIYVEPPSEVEKALAEAEAMQKDALRYRKLRATDWVRDAVTLGTETTAEQFDLYVDRLDG